MLTAVLGAQGCQAELCDLVQSSAAEVEVVDDQGQPVANALVTFSVAGREVEECFGPTGCDDVSEDAGAGSDSCVPNVWLCGPGYSGRATIKATAEMYKPAETEVEVKGNPDACGAPIGEQVTLELKDTESAM